jgi:hypothetical protein
MTACARVFVAVVLIIAGANALRAQTSEIANKTVIVTNGVVTQYWYIAPSGKIYSSGTAKGSHGYSEKGRGDEYEIGKTIQYRRLRGTLSGSTIRCQEATRADWSSPTLTLTKISAACDGGGNALANWTATIQFSGNTCIAKETSWGKINCRVVTGRQLP